MHIKIAAIPIRLILFSFILRPVKNAKNRCGLFNISVFRLAVECGKKRRGSFKKEIPA